MSNWRKWVRPGIATTILLTILAFAIRTGAVEHDLSARAGEALAAAGHGWATVSASGRSILLSGTAPSPESQGQAVAAVSDVPGVSSVFDQSVLLAIAEPYVWSAERQGKAVTLAGYVPSEATRNSILAAARRALPDAEIHDETKLARGASPTFNSAAAFALDRIAGLANGTVTITDGTLSVTGTATTSAAYAEARQAFRGSAENKIALGPVDILPARADPFVWSASYDGESITLAGFVPNEVVHETLLAAAKATLPRVPIVDNMTVASGEPEGFAEAASFAVSTLSRFREGGVTLDGLILDIAGVARSVDDYDAVMSGVSGGGLPQGMTAMATDVVPATVSPYGWRGDKSATGVTLSGYVPSPADLDKVRAAAQAAFAGTPINDHIRIASGEPKMDWIGGIVFAMGELAKLGSGSAILGDRTFEINGEASSPEAFAALVETTGHTLPASLELKAADIVPPRVSPYRFTLERGASRVILGGYAQSVKDRKSLVDMARKTFKAFEVEDRLAFASGAPPDFFDAVDASMQAIARLAGGRASIVDQAVAIDGTAYNQSAAEEITGDIADALPAGYTPTVSIVTRQVGQPLAPADCSKRLDIAVADSDVDFNGTKADIASNSFALLDRIAETLGRCLDVRVEVGAHSDTKGSASRNRDLTQSRAEAVVDYLVDAGVKRERLTAVGYGESKPVADNGNGTKTSNERVEFTVETPNG